MAKQRIDIELFSRLSIKGPRFNERLVFDNDLDTQLLDVTVLPDLKLYRDLIITLAKALYVRRTGRRVKPGFASEFQLHLFKARHGSAQPVLVRRLDTPAQGKPVQLRLAVNGQVDDFADARDMLADAIQFLSEHQRLPDDFPTEAIKPLAAFGGSLRDDDVIELAPYREARKRASYSKQLRDRVAALARRTEFIQLDVTGDFLGAKFQPKRQVSLSTMSHGTMQVPFASVQEPLVAQMVRDRRFSRMRVVGMAYVSPSRGVERFDGFPVLTIAPDVDPSLVTSVDDRLRELQDLKPGWLEGEGRALPKAGLEWVRGVLLEMMAHNGLPPARLAATEEGGVSASWHFRPWYVSADIDLMERSAYLHAAQVVTKEVHDLELSFVDYEDEALADFAAFVRRFEPREGVHP
jgi:hypothetical protein